MTGKLSLKIGFIGGGVMCGAIVEGMLGKDLVKPSQLWISGPSLDALKDWETKGCHITDKNGVLAEAVDIVFLSVKPNVFGEVIDDIISTMSSPSKVVDKLFVSILAGVPLATLECRILRFEKCRVIRVMPNTPMMVGAGCTVFAPGKGVSPEDIHPVSMILNISGHCEQVSEKMIDAVGGVSGSGPAYVFLMIEALADGGVKMGLPRDLAQRLAAHTLYGGAKMVLDTSHHPGALKDMVCSPGGSTIAAMHALERGGVRSALIDAVEAAVKRSVELGSNK